MGRNKKDFSDGLSPEESYHREISRDMYSSAKKKFEATSGGASFEDFNEGPELDSSDDYRNKR